MTTIPPEARKAARDAVRYGGHLEGECPDQPGLARAACWCCVADVAITAALPHIEAAIADRIAARYRYQKSWGSEWSSYYEGLLDGLDMAEQIARGDSDE